MIPFKFMNASLLVPCSATGCQRTCRIRGGSPRSFPKRLGKLLTLVFLFRPFRTPHKLQLGKDPDINCGAKIISPFMDRFSFFLHLVVAALLITYVGASSSSNNTCVSKMLGAATFTANSSSIIPLTLCPQGSHFCMNRCFPRPIVLF